MASLKRGGVRARSGLGIASNQRPAHLSLAMFWKAVTGLAVLSEKLESALSINLYLSISFCWTTLILVLPSVLLPPASAAGTDKGPVVSSMS